MTRLPGAAAVLIVAGQLWMPQPALAQRVSLDEATRLTWRVETRAAGVTALRALVSANPDDANARFELGRVLTWDVRTRREGIGLLEGVLERQPGRADVQEALGEVLSWDPATRAEATRLLNEVIRREPRRTSARLKLAEMLSWDPATREQSRALYRAVLRDDPESADAGIGLARLLSWSGDLSESRSWYERALAWNPEAQAARIGIAELDGLSGRARASLKKLSDAGGATVETPDTLRLRGQAYSQIGLPARALRQYERLLTLDPDNAAALRASRRLRRSLRPSLQIGSEISTESGDASNRVETGFLPLRFAFHPGGRDTEVSLTWAQAAYRNSRGTTAARMLGAAVDAPFGTYVRMGGEVTAHDIDGADRTFTGRTQIQIAGRDVFDIRLGVAREQLSSSRLSLAGERVDGILYGASFVDQAVVGAGARGRGWDVWVHATAGEIRGSNIARNKRRELFAGGGRTFHAGAIALRPAYSLGWMSYARDLSAFPGDVAGDGLTMPGIGGYFSPAAFINHMARVDVTVPVGESFLLTGGTGIGRQRVEDAWFRGGAAWTDSADAALAISARVHDRVSIGVQANYQNVAAAFDRTVVRATLTYGF